MGYTATCAWATATGRTLVDENGKALIPIWDEFISPKKEETPQPPVTKETMQNAFRSLKGTV